MVPYNYPFHPDDHGTGYGTSKSLEIFEERKLQVPRHKVKKIDRQFVLERNPISLETHPYTKLKTLKPVHWISDVLLDT